MYDDDRSTAGDLCPSSKGNLIELAEFQAVAACSYGSLMPLMLAGNLFNC